MNLEQNLCKYKHQIFLFLAGNHKFLQIPGLWNVFSINTKFSEIWFCLRSFCYRLLDLFPHSNGRYPWEDGAPGHAVPGAGQHLQHSHHQHTQGGGADSYRGLDVGLYSFRLWSFIWVSSNVGKLNSAHFSEGKVPNSNGIFYIKVLLNYISNLIQNIYPLKC